MRLAWLHCAARQPPKALCSAKSAGVSPAKRQTLVTSSATTGYIAQPGNRRKVRCAARRAGVSPAKRQTLVTSSATTGYIAQPGNRRKVRCAARRAGVSPAKRQATVTFAIGLAALRSLESRRLACETPGVGNFLVRNKSPPPAQPTPGVGNLLGHYGLLCAARHPPKGTQRSLESRRLACETPGDDNFLDTLGG